MPVLYYDVFPLVRRSIQTTGCFCDFFGLCHDHDRPRHLLPYSSTSSIPDCGTLPHTPAEIRKAVAHAEDSDKSDTQQPETSAEKSARLDLPSPQSLLESSPETPEVIPKEDSIENLQISDLRSPHSTPKLWDGNGIPNTTSKYREDQKVPWRPTPFEERLEKALSAKTVPQRKASRQMLIMLEDDSGKTATSHI